MKIKIVILAALIVILSEAAAEVTGPFLIQSLNFPKHKVGITAITDQSQAVITSQNPRRFLIHAPGLTNVQGTVSLESADWPNHYLSHNAGFLYINLKQSGGGEGRATFRLVQDSENTGYIRFESVDQPGYFIRHANSKLRVVRNDNSPLFKKDSSFRFTEGPYFLQSQNFQDRVLGIDGDTNAIITQLENGRLFNFVHPGLTGLQNTVSLETQNEPNFYLRHYGYLVDLENKDSPRNPALFAADATFKLCSESCFIDGFFSLEAGNLPNFFLRHSSSRVRMDAYQDSDLYRGDASYRRIEAPFYMESYGYPGYRVDTKEQSNLLFTEQGQRFIIIYPGLSKKPGTVSVEAANNRGHYLTEAPGDRIQLMNQAGANGDSFKQQASFFIRESPWFANTFALESSTTSGRFMSRVNTDFRFLRFQDNDDFKTSACYMRSLRSPRGDTTKISHSLVQSYNYPNHTFGLVFGSQDAFIMERGKKFLLLSPGLNGSPGTISFQSTDRPNTYLRHFASLLRAESRINPQNPGLFLDEATFFLREDKWFKGWHALEAFSIKEGFIRHSGFRLMVSVNDGTELFKRDASFRRVEGPYFLQSYNYPNYRLGVNHQQSAFLQKSGHPFYLIHPGLTSQNQSVSLESSWQSRSYLRHYSKLVDLEDASNPRNPSIFPEDATFTLYPGKFYQGYMALESVNMAKHYLRHEGYRIKMATESREELYKQDASFRSVQGMFLLESFNFRGYAMSLDNTGAMFLGRGGVQLQFVFPGLTGVQGTVSIELISSPGTYVRQQALTLITSNILDGGDQEGFKGDATWWIRDELFYEKALCLESVSHPASFIRHKDYKLIISELEDTDLFKQDASYFRISELRSSGSVMNKGPYLLQSFESPDKLVDIKPEADSQGHRDAFLSTDKGQRFYIQSPGLNNQSHTISFVSADYPNHFLRHHGYSLDVESIEGSRNPHVFDLDASFVPIVREDRPELVLFESVNFPTYFISASHGNLKIVKNDGSEMARNLASFRYLDGPYYLESLVQPNKRISLVNNQAENSKVKVGVAGHPVYLGIPGISGMKDTVSVWLAEDPRLSLRVNGQQGRQVQFIDREKFREQGEEEDVLKECSFRRNSNVNGAAVGFFALESVYYDKSHLAIDKADNLVVEEVVSGGHIAMDNAGFRLTQGPLILKSYNYKEHGLAVGPLPDQKVTISENMTDFLLIYPGLTTRPGTVSLQVADSRTKFLRHYGKLVDAEDPANPRNAGEFPEDASFYIRWNYWFPNTVAFESVNFAGHFLRHAAYRVQIAENDDSQLFKEDASFTVPHIDLSRPVQHLVITEPEPENEKEEVLSESAKAGVALLTIFSALLFMVIMLASDRIAAICCRHRTIVRREGRYDTNDGFDNPIYMSEAFSPDMTMLYTPSGGVKILDGNSIVSEPGKSFEKNDNISKSVSGKLSKDQDLYVDMAEVGQQKTQKTAVVSNPYYSPQSPQRPTLASQLSVELFVDSGHMAEYEAMAGSGLPGMSNMDLLEDLRNREFSAPNESPTVVPTFSIGLSAIDESREATDANTGSQDLGNDSSDIYLSPESPMLAALRMKDQLRESTASDSGLPVGTSGFQSVELMAAGDEARTEASTDGLSSSVCIISPDKGTEDPLGGGNVDDDIPTTIAPSVPVDLPAPFPDLTPPSPEFTGLVQEANMYAALPLTRKSSTKSKQGNSGYENREDIMSQVQVDRDDPPPLPPRNYSREMLQDLEISETDMSGDPDHQLDSATTTTNFTPQEPQKNFVIKYDDDPDEIYATIEQVPMYIGMGSDGGYRAGDMGAGVGDGHDDKAMDVFGDADLPASQSLAEITNGVLGPSGEIIPLPTRKTSKNNLLELLNIFSSEGDEAKEEGKVKKCKREKLPISIVNPCYDFDGDELEVKDIGENEVQEDGADLIQNVEGDVEEPDSNDDEEREELAYNKLVQGQGQGQDVGHDESQEQH